MGKRIKLSMAMAYYLMNDTLYVQLRYQYRLVELQRTMSGRSVVGLTSAVMRGLNHG